MSRRKSTQARNFVVGLLLMLVGGVTYGLHVYFRELAPLAFLSTVPLALLLLMPECPHRFWLFLGTVYVLAVTGLAWLSDFNTQSWLIGPLFYIPFWAPLYVITRAVRQRRHAFPLVVLWPIAFTGVEWFRVQVSPGKIPLCQLGYALVDYSLLTQVVDIFGTSALTFLLCMTAGFAAELILGQYEKNDVSRRAMALQMALIAAVFGAVLVYGFARDSDTTYHRGPTVMTVQPLFPKWLGDEPFPVRITALEGLTREASERPVDLIVWPENSLTEPYSNRSVDTTSDTIRRIEMLAAEQKASVLLDGPTEDNRGTTFHTATLVSPYGERQVYDKVVLIPWSEYLPFQRVLAAIHWRAEGSYLAFVSCFSQIPAKVSAGNPDDVRAMSIIVDGRTYWFGTPICLEIGTPSLLRRWHQFRRPDGRMGVDFIVNPTNEVLLGSGVNEQTLTAARFRAIEGRVSVVRAANVGVSALIDSNGRVQEMLVRHVNAAGMMGRPGVMIANVSLDSRSPTIYTRVGDIFPCICLLVSTILVLLK